MTSRAELSEVKRRTNRVKLSEVMMRMGVSVVEAQVQEVQSGMR